jgi:hypothetical protein
MRQTVIPAQITTVEDKIAGNLSFMQVFILMVPVFISTLIYVMFIPVMNLAIYKVVLMIISLILCSVLAFRFKGKIVLNWLIILINYNLRPKYYVFNKNDIFQRDVVLDSKSITINSQKLKHTAKVKQKNIVKDIKQIEKYLKNEKYGLTVKPNKKGGFYVAYNEITK